MAKDTKKALRREADRATSGKAAKQRPTATPAADEVPDGPGGYDADHRPEVVLAVDVALFAVHDDELVVLLVERRREPDAGHWALPGAVVEPEETMANAARRAVTGRTGILDPFGRLEQLGVVDAPARDPRTRVVSTTFLAVSPRAVPPPGGTLATGRWWPVDAAGTTRLPALAFDHLDMLASAIEGLRARLERGDLATALLDEPFTLGDLRRAYEAVWGVELEPANFRRKVLATPGFVEPTGGSRIVGTGRPAELYGRGSGAELYPPMPRAALTGQDRRPSGRGHAGHASPPWVDGSGRAGLPATTAPSGTSRVTTAPAPITASRPIVTPGSTTAPPPSHALSPTVIGRADSHLARRSSGSRGWVGVSSWTFGPIWTSSPMVMVATSRATRPKFTNVRAPRWRFTP